MEGVEREECAREEGCQPGGKVSYRAFRARSANVYRFYGKASRAARHAIDGGWWRVRKGGARYLCTAEIGCVPPRRCSRACASASLTVMPLVRGCRSLVLFNSITDQAFASDTCAPEFQSKGGEEVRTHGASGRSRKGV